VLGFSYAVVRKYADDSGAQEAALIAYYGFLSIFPILLLGVTIVSRVLAGRPELRHEVVTAMVPGSLQATVEDAAAALPASTVALVAGLVGLAMTGSGVVSSAYRTVNHVAAVPYRSRSGFVSRYARVIAVLILILAGVAAIGGLTVVAAALPAVPGLTRVVAALGSAVIAFGVLLLAARMLLDRPAPPGALWPAALPAAVVVTLVLQLGALVLPRIIRSAGPIYGSFATVAGTFTLLYVLSVALVYAAEIAAVHRAGLWPRSLDPTRPTTADVRALALLAREQERVPGQRIYQRLPDSPVGAGTRRAVGSPGTDDDRVPGVACAEHGNHRHRESGRARETDMTQTSADADRRTTPDGPGVMSAVRAQHLAWWTVLVTGILGVAFGAAVLIWPDVSLRIMAAMAGVWLVVAGLARILGAFLPGPGSIVRHVLSGVVGIIVLIAGLVCLRDLVSRLTLLAVIFGITWILGGITQLVLALETSGSVRAWLFVGGVLSLVAGIAFIATPSLSLATLVVLTGVSSLVLGACEVVIALFLRRQPAAEYSAVPA
jgi:membrane protein